MSDGTRWAKVLVRGVPGLSNQSGWRASDRLVPFSIRKELKGLGAGSFLILKDEAIQDLAGRGAEVNPENDILSMREVIVYDGRGVDSSSIENEDQALGRIIWRGFIRKPTVDVFEAQRDAMGRVTVDEFGLFLSQKPLVYDQVTPDFNPEYDGIQSGNFASGNNFRNSDFIKRSETGKWKYPEGASSDLQDQEFVWNRKRIIEFLVSNEPLIANLTFPWEAQIQQLQQTAQQEKNEIDADPSLSAARKDELKGYIDNGLSQSTNNLLEAYEWFFTDDLLPISNYEGDSIITAITELIPDTCDFIFDYNESSSGPTLIIFNKSAVDIPGVQPAGTTTNITVPDNTEVLNLTVHADEIYDRVVVKGKPILWCGTLTIWNVLQDAALKPGWTQEDEELWLDGEIGEELPGIDGTGIGSKTLNEILRRNLDRVYQRFQWIDDIPVVGARSGNFDQNEEAPIRPKKAFFGSYSGIGLSPGGDQDRILEEHEIFTSLAQHRTPNRLAMEWENFLPFPRFSEDFEVAHPNAIQYELEKEALATPFVISPTIELETLPGEYWVDRSLAFGTASSCEIGYWENGIWVRRESPQTDLHDIDEMWWLQDGGPVRTRQAPARIIEEIDNLPSNPMNDAYVGKSNFNRFLITVAGRSRERLEATKTRRGSDGSPVAFEKIKTIEVDDCEIWCVHSNTVRGLTPYKVDGYNIGALGEGPGENGRDNMRGTLIRFNAADTLNETFNPSGVHVVRDDRKKIIQFLESFSNLLMSPRSEMNLVVGMENPVNLQMGQLIGVVNDNGVQYEINSAISSIEFLFEGGPPRVSYQTMKPEIPELMRTLRAANEAKGSRPASVRDTNFARIKE